MSARWEPSPSRAIAERGPPLRILHIVDAAVADALDLACAQAALGHRVAVCGVGAAFDGRPARKSVEIVALDLARRPLTPAKAAAVARTVRDGRHDVVHAHTPTGAVLAWPICWMASVPLVTTARDATKRTSRLVRLGSRVIAVDAAVGHAMAAQGVAWSRLRVMPGDPSEAGPAGSCRGTGRLDPERAARETLGVYAECVRGPADREEEAERRGRAAALHEPLRWEI